MSSIKKMREELHGSLHDERLCRIYCCGPDQLPAQKDRALSVIDSFSKLFDSDDGREVSLFSAPGRTELGGNHTDHQHGCVLAASVNLDILACAGANGTSVVRIQSEGYPMLEVDLNDLTPSESEYNTSVALIRGIAARISQMGYAPSGFDCYAVSNVLQGSGLSSSAAYEVLIGVIFNHLYCEDSLNAVQIAQIGQYAENVFFGKPCGLMDQMASSVGSAVSIDFNDPSAPVIQQIGFDFTGSGHALCIVDSGADHADLTDEYAAIPTESKAVANFFGKEVLRDVDEAQFYEAIPRLRERCGDRAVLRAIHFYAENQRAIKEAQALADGDFDGFLALSRASGASSFMYLQNVFCCGDPQHQAVSLALAVAEHVLGDRGTFRVHGGGFAGTIQAFVPLDLLETFRSAMDHALGQGSCHVLNIRPEGGIVLLP